MRRARKQIPSRQTDRQRWTPSIHHPWETPDDETVWSESTTDEVLEGVDLSGKRVLVTGVSAGLGVETARALAAHGAQVVGAARDLAKAERATEPVRADAAKAAASS